MMHKYGLIDLLAIVILLVMLTPSEAAKEFNWDKTAEEFMSVLESRGIGR